MKGKLLRVRQKLRLKIEREMKIYFRSALGHSLWVSPGPGLPGP